MNLSKAIADLYFIAQKAKAQQVQQFLQFLLP